MAFLQTQQYGPLTLTQPGLRAATRRLLSPARIDLPPDKWQPKSGWCVGLLADHPAPANIKDEWDTIKYDAVVRPLCTATANICSANVDLMIEPELCMACQVPSIAAFNHQEINLEPTIWIHCSTPGLKRETKRVISQLLELRRFRATHNVQGPEVSRTAPWPSAGMDIPWSPSSPSTTSTSPSQPSSPTTLTRPILVQIQRPRLGAIIGMKLKFSISTGSSQDVLYSTLGGVIRINKCLYGLTTAHTVFDYLHKMKLDHGEARGNVEDDSDDSEDDLKDYRSDQSEFAPREDNSSHLDIADDDWIEVGEPKALSYLGQSISDDGHFLPVEGQPTTDFCLIDISPLGLVWNRPQMERSLDFRMMDLSMGPILGEVSIFHAKDSPPLRGVLLEGTSYLIVNGKTMQTRKIQVNDRGYPGISGSWVVQHGSILCGIVYAAYSEARYLHMLPIQDVFRDMTDFTMDQEVKLPERISDFKALYEASLLGNRDIVEVLLKEGVPVNVHTGADGTALHAASFSGHLGIVELLVESGADINVPSRAGRTALYLASEQGRLNVVKALLKRGADTKIPDEQNDHSSQDGLTCLHAASGNGHLDVVKTLLENIADIDTRAKRGSTALHAASRWGHLEIFKILLKKGANVNISEDKGDTLLTAASKGGNLSIVEILLELGADINNLATNGSTALHAASKLGHLDVVEALLKNGANLEDLGEKDQTALHEASSEGHLSIVQTLLKSGADVTKLDRNGHSALYAAARRGRLDILITLLNNRCDVNSRSDDGRSALHAASFAGHYEVAKMLLSSGADVDMLGNHGTPLCEASERGHKDVVATLIRNGADINIRSRDGRNALDIALECCQLDIIQILLSKGATNPQEWYNAALRAASKEGHLEIVEMLLESGVDVNCRSENDHSALYMASEKGHLAIMEMLIKRGADVNNSEPGTYGTALCVASEAGHLEAAEMLLRSGANVNYQPLGGHTALYMASKQGCRDIVELLIKKGANVDSVGAVNYGTALQAAAYEGHMDVVETLLKSQARINISGRYGTALCAASGQGHSDIVETLLKNKADVNIRADLSGEASVSPQAGSGVTKQHEGDTALSMASENGHMNVVELLLAYGARIDIEAGFWGSAEGAAVGRGHKEIVQRLRRAADRDST